MTAAVWHNYIDWADWNLNYTTLLFLSTRNWLCLHRLHTCVLINWQYLLFTCPGHVRGHRCEHNEKNQVRDVIRDGIGHRVPIFFAASLFQICCRRTISLIHVGWKDGSRLTQRSAMTSGVVHKCCGSEFYTCSLHITQHHEEFVVAHTYMWILRKTTGVAVQHQIIDGITYTKRCNASTDHALYGNSHPHLQRVLRAQSRSSASPEPPSAPYRLVPAAAPQVVPIASRYSLLK